MSKPPQRYFDFVNRVIRDMTMATVCTTVSGVLLIIPLHYVRNPWLRSLYGVTGVATVGLCASLLESNRQYYVKALRAYVDVSDQIQVQNQWEDRQEKVLPPAKSPEGFVTDVDMPDDLGFITWESFVTDYINDPLAKPHFNIIGATGDGKSLTAELIGDKRAEYYNGARCVYLSPTVESGEFLGWECVGNGFKKSQIEEFGEYLAAILVHRYTDKNADKTPVVVVNDEYRWSSKRADLAPAINDTIAMGRKQHLNVITTNVTNLVASQGMQGEGDLRENYTTILKGDQALKYVALQENEGTMPEGSLAYCTELKKNHPYRFCVVQNINKIMMLPDLSLYRSYKQNKGYTYKPVEQVVLPKKIEEPKRQNKYRS